MENTKKQLFLPMNHVKTNHRNASFLRIDLNATRTSVQTSDFETQLRQVYDENEMLREKLKHLEKKVLKQEAIIETLTAQNEQRYDEIHEQKALVARVAQAVAHAFKEYQELTTLTVKQASKSASSPKSNVENIPIMYKDATSIWEHSESE